MKISTFAKTFLIVGLIAALVIGANIWRNNSVVRNIKVEIDYQGCDTLITSEDVKGKIEEALPNLYSTLLSKVDLTAVESAAALSPYLSGCHANVSIGNAVVLYATQRRPIVRVMVGANEYYISQCCHAMPPSRRGSSDVIIAGGNIPPCTTVQHDTLSNTAQRDVWALAKYLDEHPDYGVLFDQIYGDERGNLYLTPKIGSHIVEVGAPINLDEKFQNLLVFYTQGLPQAGWDTYSKVSVKYRGQIVATKRNNKP